MLSSGPGKVPVISSFGTSSDLEVLSKMELKPKQFIENRVGQLDLFAGKEDDQMRKWVPGLSSAQIKAVGPELILGRLFDFAGFNPNPAIGI